jgi:hypothetical protein
MTDQSIPEPVTDAAGIGPDLWSDGNALGGPLAEVFAVDLTMANGQCAGCGRVGPLAQVRVFGGSHGLVARCPTCDAVLLRFVRSPGRCWLTVTGLRYLEVPGQSGSDIPPSSLG